VSTSSLDQLELQLEELEASADPQAAEQKFSTPWRRKPGSQLTRRWMEGFFVQARRPYIYRVSGQGARSLGWIHAPKTLILLGPRSSASEPGAAPFVPASRFQTQ